jgi:serine/threonine protein kinase
VIGAYRLESLIGQGGMSCVFAAHHMKLDRRAAVKVLYPEMAEDAEYVGRFFHEARLANEVQHPNVIEIYDFIATQDPRRVACIMELINGETLDRAIRRSLRPVQVLNVALQLADALEAVHDAGVIHRDLKPGNVMIVGDLKGELNEQPALKILDFGIAKSVDTEEAVQFTRTGMIVGTPSYMAPEQIAGEKVSPATDLYALAEIVYEMVTGRRLFEGEFVSIFRAKLLGELPEIVLPSDIGIATELSELLRACLREVPAERPPLADVRAVFEALRDQLEGESTAGKSSSGSFSGRLLLQKSVEMPSQLRYARILSALDERSGSFEEEGTELAYVARRTAEGRQREEPRRPPPDRSRAESRTDTGVPVRQPPALDRPIIATQTTEPESDAVLPRTQPGDLDARGPRRERGSSVARIKEVKEPRRRADPRLATIPEPLPDPAGMPAQQQPQGISETMLAGALLVLSVILFVLAFVLWLKSRP